MELDLRLDVLTRHLGAMTHYQDRESLLVVGTITRDFVSAHLEETHVYTVKPIVSVEFVQEGLEMFLMVQIKLQDFEGMVYKADTIQLPTVAREEPASDIVWLNRAYGYGSKRAS